MASRKKVLLKVGFLNQVASQNLVTLLIIGKVIILGDSGVGKTSLMNQYVYHHGYS